MGLVRTVLRPGGLDHGSDGAAQDLTYFFGFWSVMVQDLVLQDEICGELRHLGALRIVVALARTDQQSEHQGHHRPDHCHPEPHDLFRLGTSMVVR